MSSWVRRIMGGGSIWGPGPDCEKALEEMKSLGPAAKSFLAKHIVTDDPKLKALIREMKMR